MSAHCWNCNKAREITQHEWNEGLPEFVDSDKEYECLSMPTLNTFRARRAPRDSKADWLAGNVSIRGITHWREL